ncbi:MAG: hypothetical protein GY715_18075, partial [Planctomycetes bacterium]|nr:hypothetical protein [Planctomycetota bacterium]
RFASEHGETRSALLTRSALEYIGRGSDAAMPRARRGRPAGKDARRSG